MKKIICFMLIVCALPFPMRCFALGVSAQSAIVIDAVYGNVLYEKNAHTKMTMASTTKIMTALCAVEEGDLDKKIKVDDSAVGVEGSSIYLKYGEELTLRELVYGLMLNSGNDAAVAIACAVSGSVEKFAQLMNYKAHEIGVKNTQFKNPNGLDEEGHYTTAYDLAKITAYALKNEEFRKISATQRYTISGPEGDRYLKNHNKLLSRMEGCIGVKTGFTKKSGRCLVSACQRDKKEVVCVTLNAPDDWNDHMAMTDFALSQITVKPVAKKDESLGMVSVKNGEKKSVEAVVKNDFFVSAADGRKYVAIYKKPENVCAPVKAGQKIGYLEFYMEDELKKTLPVIAKESIAKKKSFLDNLMIVAKSFF